MEKKTLLLSLLLVGAVFSIEWSSVGPGGGGAMYVPAISNIDPDFMLIACDMSGVYRSTNGGVSWNMIDHLQLCGSSYCPAAFHPTDPNIMWDDDYRNWTQSLRRSTDGGVNWASVWDIPGTPDALFASQTPPLVLLVGSEDFGLHRSTDGETFAEVPGVSEASFIDESDCGIFIAAWNVLMRSIDRGSTFTHIPQPPAVTSGDGIIDMAAGDSAIFCLQETKLWRSTDLGASWTEVIDASVFDRGDLSFVRARGDFVWVTTTSGGYYQPTALLSTDGGDSFEPVFFCNSSYSDISNLNRGWLSLDFVCGWGGPANGFNICPNDAGIAVWTDNGRALATFDAGSTWTHIYTAFADTGETREGARWSSIGLEVTSSWDIYQSTAESDFFRIAYTDIHGAWSDDSGESWYIGSDGIPSAWSNTNYDIVADTGNGIVWGTFSGVHDIPGGWSYNYWNRTGDGGVASSTNDGRNWMPNYGGLPDLPITSIAVDYTSPPTSRRLFAAVWSNGIWRSNDGGTSWARCSEGLDCGDGTCTSDGPNTHMVEVKVHHTGAVFALKTKYIRDGSIIKNDGGLWKSTDSGDSWNLISSYVEDCPPIGWIDLEGEHSWADPVSFTLDESDVNHIWVSALNCNNGKIQGGLYETTDGGVNWNRVLTIYGAFRFTYSRYFPNLQYLATVGDGIYLSTDGGTSWFQEEDFPFSNPTRITEDIVDSDIIWVNTFGGGVWKGDISTINVPEISHAPSRPRDFAISAHPNPFNSAVTIAIDGVGDGYPVPFDVEIYDVSGRIVDVLSQPVTEPVEVSGGFAVFSDANAKLPSTQTGCKQGSMSVFAPLNKGGQGGSYVWRPHESFPSGVYLVRASVGVRGDLDPTEKTATKRVVYLK